MAEYSVSPAGEKFTIPGKNQYKAELERIAKLAVRARKNGQEVVVVKLHWRNGATIWRPTEFSARILGKIVKKRYV